MKGLIALLVFATTAVLHGCASIYTHVGADAAMPATFYSGIKFDYTYSHECMPAKGDCAQINWGTAPYTMVDAPFSFVSDTAVLPFQYIYSVRHGLPIKKLWTDRSPWINCIQLDTTATVGAKLLTKPAGYYEGLPPQFNQTVIQGEVTYFKALNHFKINGVVIDASQNPEYLSGGNAKLQNGVFVMIAGSNDRHSGKFIAKYVHLLPRIC